MQIDWLTVGAQVVNFLLLVLLLQRFLYRPVLDAMARREKRIAERLEDAARREDVAQRMAADYETHLAQIHERRAEMLAEAEEQAAARRRELLDAARHEVERAEAQWRQALRREQRELLGEMRREIAAAGESVARQALLDLADADLERQMLAKLLAQLEQLDDEARDALAHAAGGLQVSTAFAPDSQHRTQITRALHQRLRHEMPVHYVQDPSLVCGVALEAGGRRLGWSVADHLQGLEARLQERLDALESEPERQARAGPQPTEG